MSESRKSTLKAIMTQAWVLVKRFGFTLAEAMRQAWAISKLRKAMRKGVVKFAYTKVDGSIRQAWGTLAENLVAQTKGANRKANDTLVTYFDTEKQEYRCFKIANFVGMA